MSDLTITHSERIEGPATDEFPGKPRYLRCIEFSDGSFAVMPEEHYEAIHSAGMQFAANLIKRVQSR